MMFLQRTEAIASHLVSFVGVHYAVYCTDNAPYKLEAPYSSTCRSDWGGVGRIQKKESEGKYSTVGWFVKKIPLTKKMVNPDHIMTIDVHSKGSKEEPLFLSAEDFKNKHHLKIKSLEDPYTYKWFEIEMVGGSKITVDYEDNLDLIEKLHIKFDPEPVKEV